MLGRERQSLPNRPSQITPAFLTSILRDAGAVRRATVATIGVEPLAAKAIYNAQLARLHVTYDVQEASAPRSLIAKLPTVNVALQENAAVFRPGAKECWFYRHGAHRTPVNVPHCYFCEVYPATGESFLLLEDLAPARTGSWVDGASLKEADLALQTAARLHAAWWATDTTAERELAHLMDNLGEEQDLVERLYQEAWPRYLQHATFEIPDDVRQFGERLVGRVAAAETMLDRSPRTLTHGDFRVDNLLFNTQQKNPNCWVIDWEDILLWNGMLDVAWFLGGCLRVQDSEEEMGLLRRYHQALVEEGIAQYAWVQCYHDYRCTMFSCFVQGILSAVPPETADGSARELARVLGERFAMASRRLRLHELMPL